jgi:hypothetical protein
MYPVSKGTLVPSVLNRESRSDRSTISVENSLKGTKKEDQVKTFINEFVLNPMSEV